MGKAKIPASTQTSLAAKTMKHLNVARANNPDLSSGPEVLRGVIVEYFSDKDFPGDSQQHLSEVGEDGGG